MSATPYDTDDEILLLDLEPGIRLHMVLMSNNLRLADDEAELDVERARGRGLVAGLKIGNAITLEQHDALQAMFDHATEATRQQLRTVQH